MSFYERRMLAEEEERRAIEAEIPPIAQDEVALARIDAEAPVVPYPLLNGDRRTVGLGRLVWWLMRLVWWRWKSRHYL